MMGTKSTYNKWLQDKSFKFDTSRKVRTSELKQAVLLAKITQLACQLWFQSL